MPGDGMKRSGRGWVRGFFASGQVLLFGALIVALGCDGNKPAESASPPPEPDAARAPVPDAATADAAEVSADLTEAAPVPQALDPPWTTLAPSWKEVKAQVSEQDIGRMSGQAWGDDVVVRGIVRTQCGSGAILQAIFQGKKGLQVTPPMPVRFFGLGTKKEVTYQEGTFMVTVNFSHDDDTRLAGSLQITFDEDGKEQKFIELKVDGTPIPMLLEPQLSGEGRLPEMHNCYPNGRFVARTADGRQARGFVHIGMSDDRRGVVAIPLLTPQTGLQIAAASRDRLTEKWHEDLSAETATAPRKVVIEAFHTPQLTSPEQAASGNLGTQQKVTVRRGNVEVFWDSKSKAPKVSMRLTDLDIPELIEGPLRGTKIQELVIEGVGVTQGKYPKPPPAEPLELE